MPLKISNLSFISLNLHDPLIVIKCEHTVSLKTTSVFHSITIFLIATYSNFCLLSKMISNYHHKVFAVFLLSSVFYVFYLIEFPDLKKIVKQINSEISTVLSPCKISGISWSFGNGWITSE